MDSYESGSFNQSGQYSGLSEISRGGMGIVYRAIDQDAQRPVAIKVIQGENVDFSEIQRFRREADALVQLNHPNILNLIDIQLHNANLILILEYIDGHDIATLHKLGQIQRNHKADIEKICAWFENIARGMQYCHDMGMIHRDIKPHNIIIETETGRPVIIDFGIVKKDKAHSQAPTGFSLSLTAEDEVLGTPAFMAPELFTGSPATAASDVWAFGATLFFALTGMPPFPGDNPIQVYKRIMEGPADSIHSFNSRVPDWLEQICIECLTDAPLHRPHFKTIIERFQSKSLDGTRRSQSPLILKVLGALIVLASVLVAGLVFLTPDYEPLPPVLSKKQESKSPARLPGPPENRNYDLHYFLNELSDSASMTRLPEEEYSAKCRSGTFKSGKAEIAVTRTLFDVAGPGCLTRIFLSKKVKSGTLSIYIDRAPTATFEFQLKDVLRSGYKTISNPWFEAQSERVSIYLPIPFRKRCKIVFSGDTGPGFKTIYYSVDFRKYKDEDAPIVSLTKKLLDSSAEKLHRLSTRLKRALPNPVNVSTKSIPKGQTTTLLRLQSDEKEGGRLLRQWGLRLIIDKSLQKEAYGLILKMNIDGENRVTVPLLAFLMMNLTNRIDPYKFKLHSRFTQIEGGYGWARSNWPIAFKETLTIELENRTNTDQRMEVFHKSEPSPWTDKSLYFTAHWKRADVLTHLSKFGLSVDGTPGYYVGTYLTVHNPVNFWWSFGPFTINTDKHELGSPPSRYSHVPFQEFYFGNSYSLSPLLGIRELHDEKNSYESQDGVWNGSPVNDSRGRNASSYFRWREFDRVFFKNKLSIDFMACHEFPEMVQGRSMISFFYLQKRGPPSDPVGSTKLPSREDLFRGAKINPGDVLIEGEEMLTGGRVGRSKAKSKTFSETATTGPFGYVRGVMNWNCFGCLYWSFSQGDSVKKVTVYAPVKRGRYKVYFHGFRTQRNPLRLTLNDQVISGKKWTTPDPKATSFPRVYWGEFQIDGQVKLTIELSGSDPLSEELYLDYLHFVPVS